MLVIINGAFKIPFRIIPKKFDPNIDTTQWGLSLTATNVTLLTNAAQFSAAESENVTTGAVINTDIKMYR